jgi:CheY-like chemotaxis protein
MCHVLIIEDDPIIALDIQHLLSELGAASFMVAETEEEAIRAAVRQPPALITSDVKLRTGTGPAAVKAIHEQLGDIPVIFITGTPESCRPCAPPGRVLIKPLNEPELARAFQAMTQG